MESVNFCDNLAQIIGGKSKIDNGVCMITVDRRDLNVTIGGRPFAVSHMFEMQSPDSSGNYLINGEIALLENEVPYIVSSLSNANIIVSSLHSHWLYDSPKLIYVHLVSIMNPEVFITKMAQILKIRP
jgi:Domain of Unknown Function (DUF1259).